MPFSFYIYTSTFYIATYGPLNVIRELGIHNTYCNVSEYSVCVCVVCARTCACTFTSIEVLAHAGAYKDQRLIWECLAQLFLLIFWEKISH